MWDSIARERMELQQCTSCRRFRYPPGPICPHCLAMEHDWQPVSGRGTILSWVVFHRQYFEDFAPPYNAVAVQLAEGPIVVSNLIGDEPKGSWIGAAVEPGLFASNPRLQGSIAVRFALESGDRPARWRHRRRRGGSRCWPAVRSAPRRRDGGTHRIDCGARGAGFQATTAARHGCRSATLVAARRSRRPTTSPAADVVILDAASARQLRDRPPIVAALAMSPR